jgi:AH receptor-interacting protein
MKHVYIFFREKPEDEEWLELRSQKIPLLLNFSQCKLLMNEYYPVIEHCSEVLTIDPGKLMTEEIRDFL